MSCLSRALRYKCLNIRSKLEKLQSQQCTTCFAHTWLGQIANKLNLQYRKDSWFVSNIPIFLTLNIYIVLQAAQVGTNWTWSSSFLRFLEKKFFHKTQFCNFLCLLFRKNYDYFFPKSRHHQGDTAESDRKIIAKLRKQCVAGWFRVGSSAKPGSLNSHFSKTLVRQPQTSQAHECEITVSQQFVSRSFFCARSRSMPNSSTREQRNPACSLPVLQSTPSAPEPRIRSLGFTAKFTWRKERRGPSSISCYQRTSISWQFPLHTSHISGHAPMNTNANLWSTNKLTSHSVGIFVIPHSNGSDPFKLSAEIKR